MTFSDFPLSETVRDASGHPVEFEISAFTTPVDGLISIDALETDSDINHWSFSVLHYVGAEPLSHALVRLRRKMERRMSTRHFNVINGSYVLTHGVAVGDVDSGGVMIDGAFVPMDRLMEMIQSHEGFQFRIEFVDSTDDFS